MSDIALVLGSYADYNIDYLLTTGGGCGVDRGDLFCLDIEYNTEMPTQDIDVSADAIKNAELQYKFLTQSKLLMKMFYTDQKNKMEHVTLNDIVFYPESVYTEEASVLDFSGTSKPRNLYKFVLKCINTGDICYVGIRDFTMSSPKAVFSLIYGTIRKAFYNMYEYHIKNEIKFN